MDDKINPRIVMDEDLVQKGVMDGKFVKNFVMDAKIDPKVVMDLSIFKILVDGTACNPLNQIRWRNLLIRMNRGCWSEFQAELHSL